ncbi:MAG: hypothetical protein L6R41_003311 [Letrouitia leprolyta]|nr:MAG: hypothetical protein L6R41_003311 [Letrouitia leprolyta]
MLSVHKSPALRCVSRTYIRRHLLSGPSRGLPLLLTPALYSSSSKAIPYDPKHSTAVSLRQTKSPPIKSSDALNPPSSTLPPPLTLPTRPSNLSGTRRFTFYYQTGKAYLTFYKSGIKSIYQNYKTSRQLRSRILPGKSLEQALRDDVLSRAEYHLMKRTRRDALRIPLFGIVLVICGEFTPLVVIFMGLNSAVPRTCHIPRQIDGAREKLEARRKESFRHVTLTGNESGKLEDVQKLSKPILVHVGKSLGLYSSLWDKVGLAPTVILPWRIRNAVDRIEADDFAIKRDGGVKRLSEEEVKLAAEDRGLDVVGKPLGEIRSLLAKWMEARNWAPVIGLVSRRPSTWPREQ